MKMRKFCLLSATACMIAGSIVFTSCNKDNGGSGGSTFKSITAKVDNDEDCDSVDEVYARIYYGSEEVYKVADGDYTKGGFSIEFPATVKSQYLMDIEYFCDNLIDIDVKISAKNAQIALVWFEGFTESGDYVGDFYYEKESKTSDSEALFLYVDESCTVKGSEKDEDYSCTIDISLKEGWNIIYYTETDKSETLTSKDPGGLKWIFYDESSYKSYQPEGAAQTSAKKSSFAKSKLFPKVNFKEIVE